MAQEPIIVEVPPPQGSRAPKSRPTPRPRPAFVAPKLLWQTKLDRIDGTPLVQNGNVFVGAGEKLHCLDSNGRIVWSVVVGNIQGTPVTDATSVYIGTERGLVLALNRKTGQTRWKFVTEGNATVLTSPSLFEDRLFVEATDNNVYALSLKNGQLRWKFNRPDGSLGYSSPLADNGAVFVAGETTFYSLGATTGKQFWRTFLGGKSLSAPATNVDTLFVGGDETGLTALSRKDGSVVWTFKGKSDDDWFGPPVLVKDTLYVSTYRRFVYAVEAATGKQKWSALISGNALTRPVLDAKRGTLFVTSSTFANSPTLTALSAYTGSKRWEYKMDSVFGSPVIEGDRLYVGSTDGNLYAFQL